MVIYMFNKYKIKNNILYLYIDDSIEIGSFFDKDKYSLIDKIKKFIKDKNIKFNGSYAILIMSGLMIGSVYLSNNVSDIKDVDSNYKYVYGIVDKSIPKFNIDKIDNNKTDIIKEDNYDKTEVNSTINDIKKEEVSNKNNLSNEKKVSSNINVKKEDVSSNTNITSSENNNSNNIVITLNRSNGEVINIDLDEYLIGVVASEMPASFNIEALKAQAIASRTYTLKLIEQNRSITDTISTQNYKSNDELKKFFGSNYNTYYNKVKDAVMGTKNLCIKYNGKLIDAVYHSTSNGYTEDSQNVWGNDIAYLKSVVSSWDTNSSSFLRTTNIYFDDISSKLGFDFNSNSIIEILSRDESNRISKIKVGDNIYTGVEIRNLLNLRSADFDILINNNYVTFTTRGYGHGVGMSQYGANGMANSGYKYDQILKYYYTNVTIDKI